MRTAASLLLAGSAVACPPNWDSPCVIEDTSSPIAPVSWKRCPAQYDLGKLPFTRSV
jgi:hypothetical protein